MEEARRNISLVEARNILLSRIPLKALPHEVIAAQVSIFDDGLQCFHAAEYDRALRLFHDANDVQENNPILFAMSCAYYLTGKYEEARVCADRIDVTHCWPDSIPEVSDIETLYFLIDAQAAGWEEQEDNYRLSGVIKLYIASDLLQHAEYHLPRLANIKSPNREQNKKRK